MKYAMENKIEALRLEKQAQQNGYTLNEELAGLTLPSTGVFLDAGCGSGLLARHLKSSSPTRKIIGCDMSEMRLQQAKKSAQEQGLNIEFRLENLAATSFEDHSIDVIFCRYVFEHVPQPQVLLKEFKRILKPGGRLIVINFDGIVVNLASRDSLLQEQLKLLAANYTGDLYVASKLPILLADAGFSAVNWKATCMDFQGENRLEEIENSRMRFHAAQATLETVFGGKEQAEAFKQRYVKALQDPCSTLFYTKFIVQGDA